MIVKKQLIVLYIGDIMGKPGRDVVTKVLPGLRRKHKVNLVIAQAENVSHGKGMTPGHMHELQKAGVDFFTGGNHTIERPAILPLLEDQDEPVIAPINQGDVKPRWGAKTIETPAGTVLVVSLLGAIFPGPQSPSRNPLLAIDMLLKKHANVQYVARIVNFHGDYSSEKRVIGYYLDGRVSAVLGDHWHVATSDAMVLPHGTAHQTDVGMCGTIHSSIGVEKEIIIRRWRDSESIKMQIAESGPYQFNAAIIHIDTKTQLASKIQSINLLSDEL